VNKTTASVAQLANAFCFDMLIHVQLLVSSCASTNKTFIQLFIKLA